MTFVRYRRPSLKTPLGISVADKIREAARRWVAKHTLDQMREALERFQGIAKKLKM